MRRKPDNTEHPEQSDAGTTFISPSSVLSPQSLVLIQTDRLIRDFLELVQIPGLPLQEGLIGEAVCRKLEELRIPWEVDRAGASKGAQTGNIIARLPGNVPTAVPIAFAAHMDVVAPLDGMVPSLSDGIITSDGHHILGADNRSAIAELLETVRVLKERALPHGDLELLFTIDEEGRMTGARDLDLSRLQARYIFAPDSDNPANLERYGSHYVLLQLDFFGKAAHAQTPSAGINAIQMAAIALAQVRQGALAEATTLNFGKISGGLAENVIPAHVSVIGELRGLDRSRLAVEEALIRSVCEETAHRLGGRVQVRSIPDLEGYVLQRNDPIVVLVERAMGRIGLRPVDITTGGNAESNVFNSRGLPSISLGTGAYNAHACSEYAPVSDLVAATRLFLALVQEAVGSRQ